jgi:cobalt-zinc-cadmium efflux system outer membrane protein
MLLSGCSSLPTDLGRGDVAALVEVRGRPAPSADEATRSRLIADLAAKPLTPDTAARIALVNNPRLKAEYARLGIASAEVYDAGRLSNPRLSGSWLNSNESGAADQVTFGLAQSFTSLLLLGPRSRLAQAEFTSAQQSAGAEILNLAAETETAFYTLAGAQQIEKMREAVARAAGLSAELAQRFFDAGNITRLELSREQAAATQARLDLLEAQAKAAAIRAKLNALMGLKGGTQAWTITAGLPSPLPKEDESPELLRLAGESRLDVLAARNEVKFLADSLGVTRRFRYLGELEVGVETERETDRSRLTGPTFSWQLPIFNQGKGAVAKAQAQMQSAEARLQALEIAATNSVQLASLSVANAKARAETYRTALIPQREQIVARSQEQVNYMLIGQFELLRAKQEEYDAYQGYLEAVSDYWVARAELAREVGTRLPSSAQTAQEVLDAEVITAPKESSMGGMQMDGMKGMEGMDHGSGGMQMKDSGDGMKGMQHDMPGMDKSGGGMKDMDHGKQQTPKKDTAPPMPPARKQQGHGHQLPSGMESHIPARAVEKSTPNKKDDKPNPDDPKGSSHHH